MSARPEPEACAAWLDTLRAEFESRYSTGAYVGRTKTIGRGDSYNFEALAETLRRLASSFDDDEIEETEETSLVRRGDGSGSILAGVTRGRNVRARCVTALAVMLAAFVALLAACGGYGCLNR